MTSIIDQTTTEGLVPLGTKVRVLAASFAEQTIGRVGTVEQHVDETFGFNDARHLYFVRLDETDFESATCVYASAVEVLSDIQVGDIALVPAGATTAHGGETYFGGAVQAKVVCPKDHEGDVVVEDLVTSRQQYVAAAQLTKLDLSDPIHEQVTVHTVAAVDTLPAGAILTDIDGDDWPAEDVDQYNLDEYGPMFLKDNDVLLDAPAELVAEQEATPKRREIGSLAVITEDYPFGAQLREGDVVRIEDGGDPYGVVPVDGPVPTGMYGKWWVRDDSLADYTPEEVAEEATTYVLDREGLDALPAGSVVKASWTVPFFLTSNGWINARGSVADVESLVQYEPLEVQLVGTGL